MNEKRNLLKFINAIGEKNYHQANKYLRAVIDDKLKTKIASAVKNTRIF